jgi:cephalosporin-C deacetylase
MAFFDLSPETLQTYRSQAKEPKDFVGFWESTLAHARKFDLNPTFAPYNSHLPLVTCYDVTFSGFGGQRIRGWYILPVPSDTHGKPLNQDKRFPVVLQFIGYGGGRGLPVDWLGWPASGYATLVMDTRGQGSGWQTGDTSDGGFLPEESLGPQVPGFMTRGIQSPETYYFTRLITDGVRAVEAIAHAPGAKLDQVIITGISQGGGLTLAVSGLAGSTKFDQPSMNQGWSRPEITVVASMPDVPFLCDFPRAVGLTDSNPYGELTKYLKIHRDKIEQTFQTLSYIDGVHFSSYCTWPGYFSTALMDIICPPSTVFGAYHNWPGEKAIEIYQFNDHEGGQRAHFQKQQKYLKNLLV